MSVHKNASRWQIARRKLRQEIRVGWQFTPCCCVNTTGSEVISAVHSIQIPADAIAFEINDVRPGLLCQPAGRLLMHRHNDNGRILRQRHWAGHRKRSHRRAGFEELGQHIITVDLLDSRTCCGCCDTFHSLPTLVALPFLCLTPAPALLDSRRLLSYGGQRIPRPVVARSACNSVAVVFCTTPRLRRASLRATGVPPARCLAARLHTCARRPARRRLGLRVCAGRPIARLPVARSSSGFP
mmetsp:Transcript_78135/g.208908  ORF Transcript_78135/g.208908 Transcript_78135/m.208908 type:complete len:241 (-) Transcript_78135:250-972(-)